MRIIVLLILLLFLCLPSISFAQGTSLIGKVINEEGDPIEGVNVNIENTFLGTSTNEVGLFRLFILSSNPISIRFQHLEYKGFKVRVEPAQFQDTLFVSLEKEIRYLDQVEIIGSAEDEQREQVSVIKVNPKTARLLPSPFSEFNKILATLPGVTSNNELSASYSVRGGNFDENLVYVNDIPIYRPFLIRAGQQEGLSFINPDLVENVEFSSGGWQPKYGDKLSSSLNIYYKKPEELAGSMTLGLLGGSAHIEGASANNKISYIFGARNKSAQYLLNTLETNGEYLPKFVDIQSYVNFDLSKKDEKANTTELGVLLSYSRNRYLVRPQSRETTYGTINQVMRLFVAFEGNELMNYDSFQGGLKLTHSFSDKLKSFLLFSILNTSEREYLDIEGAYRLCDVNSNIGSAGFNECATIKGVGTNYEYARNKLLARIFNIETRSIYDIDSRNTIEFGAGGSTESIDDNLREFSFVDSVGFVLNNRSLVGAYDLLSTRYTAFIQHTALLPNHQTLTYGVRLNYWSLNNQLLVSPRLQYSIKPMWSRDFVFKAAIGVYQQPPFYREMRDFSGNLNANLKAQKSVHAILGMDYDFVVWGRAFKFFAETYYKHLDNVIPYDVDNVRIRYYANNNATAYAAGIDMRVSGEFIPGAESWFSLGLLTTKEDIKNDEAGYIRRPSDQTVNLGIFFQDHIPNDPTLRMNLNLLFGSGLPFGPPNNKLNRNSFKGRPYKRVDIGLSKLLVYNQDPKKILQSLSIGVEILNLLGNNNPISYTWIKDVNNTQYGIPNYLSARFFNIKAAASF